MSLSDAWHKMELTPEVDGKKEFHSYGVDGINQLCVNW